MPDVRPQGIREKVQKDKKIGYIGSFSLFMGLWSVGQRGKLIFSYPLGRTLATRDEATVTT